VGGSPAAADCVFIGTVILLAVLLITEKTAERQPAPTAANPGLTKNWYLNRAGVLTLEHAIPKMESVKLREADVINL
jgi:hypothetical protein